MKRISMLIALIAILALPTICWAAPTILLNGENLSFDTQIIIEDGRTMVPLRAIFEALGANVKWDGAAKTVTATKSDTVIKLVIEGRAYKNGQPVILDVPAKIIDNRTMVPLRFVSESFGCNVSWDGGRQLITINYKEKPWNKARITLAFDDGTLDCYTTAKPILDKYGFVGVANIVTEHIGTPNHMTIDQLKEIYADGWEIASQSKTHSELAKISHERQREEIRGSKESLESLGFKVYSFAAPVNSWNIDLGNMAKLYGYTSVCGAPKTPLYELYPVTNRYNWVSRSDFIGSRYSFEDVKKWIDSTVQRRGWIILTFQKINYENKDDTISPEVLEEVCAYISTLNVDIVTQSQGWRGI